MNKRMSGFTAVELMIVLAIMGIMLVAAVPSFVQFTRNSRIKSGAQIVVSALRTARSHAIKRRKRCAVLFNMNIDNSGYAVKIYWEPDISKSGSYPEGGSVTNWKALPKTMIMTTESALTTSPDIPFPNDADTSNPKSIERIVFKPTGGASGNETIQVSDDDKTNPDTSYIAIQMITGRIKTSRTP